MTILWRGKDGERIAVECWGVDQILEHTDERFWPLFNCDYSPRILSERTVSIKDLMKSNKCLPLPEISCNDDGTVCSIQDGQRRIAAATELTREPLPIIVYYSKEHTSRSMSCEEWEKLNIREGKNGKN